MHISFKPNRGCLTDSAFSVAIVHCFWVTYIVFSIAESHGSKPRFSPGSMIYILDSVDVHASSSPLPSTPSADRPEAPGLRARVQRLRDRPERVLPERRVGRAAGDGAGATAQVQLLPGALLRHLLHDSHSPEDAVLHRQSDPALRRHQLLLRLRLLPAQRLGREGQSQL